MVRCNIEQCREDGIRVLTHSGLSPKDSAIVVDSMIQADYSGISTHGIRMLPVYIEKLEEGFFNIGQISILKQTHSYTTVNSNNIIGAISAASCVEIAAEKAKTSGIHAVFAKNCNTFGSAFYFAKLLAQKDLVGVVFCNSPAAMPAFNGIEPLLGTNPIAFACPSKSEGMIIFDMATSIISKSKIGMALEKNEQIPKGWALDKSGMPTSSPAEAIKGLLLPIAGFKGYSLAIMLDIIAGLISGSGYLNKVNKFYSSDNRGMNAGHFFLAIDPQLIYGETFKDEMDHYIQILRTSKSIANETIVVPGDRSNAMRKKVEENGFYLDEALAKRLEELFGHRL